MTLPRSYKDRELKKFVECPENEVAVRVKGSDSSLVSLIDASSSDFIYIGSALPSTSKSDAKWRIQRVDLRTSLIEILFADSTEDFTNVWDNRAGLVYG